MGIPTPTYYDQLLLTKCKLLLQAALANPKRKGGSYSWEEFVTGLDERDEGTIRTFEVLLQETAVRRPRKTTTTTTNEVAQVGGGNRRRGRTVIPVASRLNQRHFAASTIEESDDSSNSSDSDPPFEVSQDLERFLGVPPPRERVPENRPVGIPIDRTITTTTTTSSGGGAGIPSTDPSQRLREHERGSLFGFDEPSPSFSELLNNIAAVANENETDFLTRSSRSHLSPIIPRQEEEEAETTPAEGEEDHYNSELPTFQELWQVVVTENEQQQQSPAARFPSESINSFDSFLNRLNSTLSNNNINPLTSGDMNGLLAELTLRDVSIPIRIRNAISRRRGGGSSSLRRRITEHLQGGQRIQTRDGGDESSSPLMEGIWRIQAGPAQVVVGSSSSSEGVRNTFSEFARRRRAITREREEEGAGGGAIAGTTTTTSSSSNNETPTSSTTPVTSQAPSPISTCPPPPPLAPLSTTLNRPLTSADRAIAAIRQQREIAPLPNSSTLTLTTTNGGAVPHEYRNRSNGDLARRNWIDNMIERGRRFLAEDEAMYGTTPTGEVPENEDARQAIERIRALTASRLETDGN